MTRETSCHLVEQAPSVCSSCRLNRGRLNVLDNETVEASCTGSVGRRRASRVCDRTCPNLVGCPKPLTQEDAEHDGESCARGLNETLCVERRRKRLWIDCCSPVGTRGWESRCRGSEKATLANEGGTMSERDDEPRKDDTEDSSSDDDLEFGETDEPDEDEAEAGDKMPDGVSPLLDVGSEE
jgi:hypothetical protein